MDRLQDSPVILGGGLTEQYASLLQAAQLPGTAVELTNYEPALEGGYERIQGYTKWDSNVVPGATNAPILGHTGAFNGALAARKNSAGTSVDIYYSAGTGWGTKINSANQDPTATKYRMLRYNTSKEVVTMADGKGYALKYDGTTDTLINGTGAPTAPKYLEYHINRLVLAPASDSSSFALSAPNNDVDFDGTNGAVEISTGDVITGMKVFRSELYIFCVNSIWKLTGRTQADFALESVTKSIGCVSGDTIQEIGGDLIFLAPDGLRSVAATDRIGDTDLGVMSKAIQPSLRPLIGSTSPDNFSSLVIRKKSQYRLLIQDTALGDAEANGFLGRVSPGEGGLKYEWSTLKGINAYSTSSVYDDSDEVVLFGHPSNGYLYQLESGNSFDGAAIKAIYESPPLIFEAPSNRKRYHSIAMIMQLKGNINLQLNLLLDTLETGVLQPGSIVVTQAGEFPTYGSAVYGTDTYAFIGLQKIKKNLVGTGFTASIRVESNDSNPPHRLDSYVIQYITKGRR